ncbi:DUF2807 domain-containing protein [Hymenobacter sp. UV11]|uniref:head GIN domain-containing protein n=1 Tax=Hymenobacter sp. UV11 TaxID=1849735 RepID=UPI00105E1330|nr:head GIN domain-containing protein [Hymenobacter sp. UV11]TDN37595.1 hypothetical protein A8B98_03460 [Hymenobacter sp. UV11]TFZ68792.1 DUF2807 domain-containing protein [Hymenobacter sp. UV11]
MKKLLLPLLLWLVGVVPVLAQAANGPQVRSLAPFHAITVGTGIELLLTAGHAQRVEVSATTADFRDHILTAVVSGVLSIHYENPDDRGFSNVKRERNSKQLRVAVTADQLTALTAGSGAQVRASGNFTASDFQLDASSGANCQASDLVVGVLVVRQSSGSTVTLSGRAPRFDLRIASGSTFDGEGLQTDRGQIEATNGSTVRLAVRESLLAEASSGAAIRYFGSPAVTKEVSGGGSVGK